VSQGEDHITDSIIFQNGGSAIGIRTTNPAYTLDVSGSFGANSVTTSGDALISGVSFLGGGNTLQLTDKPHFFRISGGGLGISANNEGAGNQPIYFYTAGTIRLTVSGSGNVGIGTTNPGDSRLQISGTHPSGNAILRVQAVSTDTATIGLFGTAGTRKGMFYYDSSRIGINSLNDPIIFEPGDAEKMRITTAGNVGIGETSPSSMLHFSRQTTWGTSDNRIININNTGTGGDINTAHNMGSITWYSGNSTPTAEIAAYRNTPASGNNIELRFYTAAAGTPSERLRITSGGNVGIGTTNPSAKLEVPGNYKLYGGGSNTGYTGNGLWGATATPNFIGSTGYVGIYGKYSSTTGGLLIGYQDNAAGLYSPAYGFEVKSTDGRPVAGNVVKAIIMKDTDTNGEPMVIYNNGSSYWENSMEVAKTLGTYAQLRLTSDATYASVARDYIVTSSSTVDITTERTDGGAFNFLLLISSTLIASASHRNYYTFVAQGRGTTATATQLSNVSAGTASRTAISVSFPSNGVIRLTLTGGESCQVKVTAIGHGAL
jgi:hypothetical protein